ncbi:MAG TPA: hypothetical protein VFI91_03685 [Longimicrobiaceae bacterium]|nr:hypothetical protein [Longimicrobiaceae bacterium]
MDSQETHRQTRSRVTRELGSMIRRQAHKKWDGVRTAERNEGKRHVWRFRSGPDSDERFLHVPHQSMAREGAAEVLVDQLRKARWLDRLQAGPETSFVLSPAGRLQPWPRA